MTVLIMTLCICLQGQSNFASIVGRVDDPSHASVSAAQITARAKDTGATRSVTSNSEGIYRLASLPPGGWTVEAEAPGFSRFSREVTLEVGQSMGLKPAT